MSRSADTRPTKRPDLSNRALIVWVGVLAAAILAYAIAKPMLPAAWQQPGTVLLQPVAALGALFLLVPFAFSIGKRGGHSKIPNKLFIAHVGASLIGMFLIALHATAKLEGPPLFMVAFLLLLVVSGVFARVYMAPRMATTFGTKSTPFTKPDENLRAELRKLIDRKAALLAELDPAASEALFSVTLSHLIRAPFKSLAYLRLVRLEERMIGARKSVPFLQAYWRPFHMALAWLFLAGLVVHVLLVTFFAGYVADGREIYWWHLAAW